MKNAYARLERDDSVSEKDSSGIFVARQEEGNHLAIESIVSDQFYNLEEYASSHISDVAKKRSETFLKKVCRQQGCDCRRCLVLAMNTATGNGI